MSWLRYPSSGRSTRCSSRWEWAASRASRRCPSIWARTKGRGQPLCHQLTAVAECCSAVLCLTDRFGTERTLCPPDGRTGDMMEYSAAYLHIQLWTPCYVLLLHFLMRSVNAQGKHPDPDAHLRCQCTDEHGARPAVHLAPPHGCGGCALATVLSKVITALPWSLCSVRNHGVISLDSIISVFDKERISRCMKVALPSIIGQSGSSFGFIVQTPSSFPMHCDYGCIWYGKQDLDLVNQPFSSVAGSLTAIVGQPSVNNLQRAKGGLFRCIAHRDDRRKLCCSVPVLLPLSADRLFPADR